MIKGLNYTRALSESEYYNYLEPKLTIFEDFYEYLISNGYDGMTVEDFSIHGAKNGVTVQLLFDISKYYQYAVRIWNKYNLIFIYQDGKYKLHGMDENKEFENITQIIEYLNHVSGVTL